MKIADLPPYFQSRIAPSPITGCWQWTGYRHKEGYGGHSRREAGARRHYIAHRTVYELLVGPIPAGLQIDHLCRNRGCVNPAHLEPVTPQENTRRGFSFVAVQARMTACKRGHEFTPENTYRWRNMRHCRACRALRNAGSAR